LRGKRATRPLAREPASLTSRTVPRSSSGSSVRGPSIAGVRYRVSLATYPAAWCRISCSRFSRTGSARRLERASCSGVTPLTGVPLRVPASAVLIPLRSLCSLRSGSLTTAPADCPSHTRVTAYSLNAVVSGDFGIFLAFSFMIVSMVRHVWKTKFRGIKGF
jgi:hypothetical protein